MLRAYVVLLITGVAFLTAGGCGKQQRDEPTKHQSQAGLEKLTQEAERRTATDASARSIAENSKFLLVKNMTPSSAAAKDIDGIIRPVLVKLFQGAKLVSAKGPEAPKIDGEVVEDRMVYSLMRVLTEGDGDALHSIRGHGL